MLEYNSLNDLEMMIRSNMCDDDDDFKIISHIEITHNKPRFKIKAVFITHKDTPLFQDIVVHISSDLHRAEMKEWIFEHQFYMHGNKGIDTIINPSKCMVFKTHKEMGYNEPNVINPATDIMARSEPRFFECVNEYMDEKFYKYSGRTILSCFILAIVYMYITYYLAIDIAITDRESSDIKSVSSTLIFDMFGNCEVLKVGNAAVMDFNVGGAILADITDKTPPHNNDFIALDA